VQCSRRTPLKRLLVIDRQVHDCSVNRSSLFLRIASSDGSSAEPRRTPTRTPPALFTAVGAGARNSKCVGRTCAIACRTDTPAIEYVLADLGQPDYRGYRAIGIAEQAVAGDVVTPRTNGRRRAPSRRVAGSAGLPCGSIGTRQPAEAAARKHQRTCDRRRAVIDGGLVADETSRSRSPMRQPGRRRRRGGPEPSANRAFSTAIVRRWLAFSGSLYPLPDGPPVLDLRPPKPESAESQKLANSTFEHAQFAEFVTVRLRDLVKRVELVNQNFLDLSPGVLLDMVTTYPSLPSRMSRYKPPLGFSLLSKLKCRLLPILQFPHLVKLLLPPHYLTPEARHGICPMLLCLNQIRGRWIRRREVGRPGVPQEDHLEFQTVVNKYTLQRVPDSDNTDVTVTIALVRGYGHMRSIAGDGNA
jgi:hypothetical protein